jgi:hypothetical protein
MKATIGRKTRMGSMEVSERVALDQKKTVK